MSLPLVLLHQLGDHHDHRHLEKKNEGHGMSIFNHLFLDDHVPEVVERLRLGSLGGQEFLLAGAEDDLACVHEVHLRSRKREVEEGNFLLVFTLSSPWKASFLRQT